MNEQQLIQSIHELAAQAVPDTMDLWPSIRAQLEGRHAGRLNRWTGAARLNLRLKWWVARRHPLLMSRYHALLMSAFILVILVLGLAGVCPAIDGLVPLSAPGHKEKTGKANRVQLIPLPAAQRLVPFYIPLPTWLPEGLQLQGARVVRAAGLDQRSEGGSLTPPVLVTVVYCPTPESTAGIFITVTQGGEYGRFGFPPSAAQQVRVNGQPATYVHGVENKNGTWDATADYGALVWAADGLTYELRYSELGLNQATLIRIAESLR